ncbi:MAG: hypothetical protein U9R16_00985 [Campylobacterota bacterium]|nr:hypothetical protein [Campylobacterota bacterium]
MYHIHDELDYLANDTIMMLNDKYLRKFSTFTSDEIVQIINLYTNKINQITDDEKYIDVDINDFYGVKLFSLQVKEIHLYKLTVNCLQELNDRNIRGSRWI